MAGVLSKIRGFAVTLTLMVGFLGATVIQAQVNVTTYHNDNARTGQNLRETILTLDNVNPATFGKLFTQLVDGNVYAQPLYLSDVKISEGVRKNVVFVATEQDSIYAFDADSNEGPSGGLLWHNKLIDPDNGITWIDHVEAGRPDICCCCPDIIPDLGISATPVIDAESGILYTITKTKEIRGDERHYVQTLYALKVATGDQVARFVIGDTMVSGSSCSAGGLTYTYDDFGPTVMGSPEADDSVGGIIHFNAVTNHQRSGLVLHNGVVFAGWSSHCDHRPYHGWVMGFDASTLRLLSWFNATPGGVESAFHSWGAGIWMGGGAPAIDGSGNLYCSTGNGGVGEDVSNNDYGEAVLRLSTSDLRLGDFFVPHNQRQLDMSDADLASGGVLLLPDQKVGPPHLLVTAGKEGAVYLIDRDNMGGFSTTEDGVVQVLPARTIGGGGLQGTPALYQNRIYFAGSGDFLKAFDFSGAPPLLSATPVSQSLNRFGNKGATASVSANGDRDAIVWATEHLGRYSVLHAYDALNLDVELYNSGEDGVLGASKFALPTIANGKVYIGIGQSSPRDFGSLVVFGLLSATGEAQR